MRTVELSTHIKCFSRSKGHSAVAAAAYRAGVWLTCERTGITHDYRRRSSAVVVSGLLFPDCTDPIDRKTLWNAVEAHETRKNSRVAREWMFALPADLSALGRRSVVEAMAWYLVNRHGVAVDYAIHAPPRGGDQRNHHCHMLMTTRRVQDGQFAEKCRELDSKDSGSIVKEWRAKVAELENAELQREARAVHIEHRSFASRGVPKTPEQHRGKQRETQQSPHRLKSLFERAASGLMKTGLSCRAHFWVCSKPVRIGGFLVSVARYVYVLHKPCQGSNATSETQLRQRDPPANQSGFKLTM